MGHMCGVLAWMAYLREWQRWCACVGGMLVSCVGGVGGVLAWEVC